MLSSEDYVRISLEYNLFWVRIMKEHAIFIEASLPGTEKQLAAQADQFKQQYDRVFAQTIRLANGSISDSALRSGQYVTRYTEVSEQIVQKVTGIDVDGDLTRMEYDIVAQNPSSGRQTEQTVSALNQYLLSLTSSFARFKSDLLASRMSCRVFSNMYVADIDHVLREAQRYIEVLQGLQSKDENFDKDYIKFWDQNMSDHAKSMRGQFDPTETAYFSQADDFAKTFDALAAAAVADSARSLTNTLAISNFKANTTEGLINCRIKSIMNPLFTDHLLREANHFVFLLRP